MACLPQTVAGTGVGCIGAGVGCAAIGHPIPGCITGVLGLTLTTLGCKKKKAPRGKAGCDMNKQTKFFDGTGEWKNQKDEDGNVAPVYHGEKGVLGLPLEDASAAQKDKNGLVTSYGPDVSTTYDVLFKNNAFNDKHAVARCMTQHTFKDEIKSDGTPNPKPQIVDKPGTWGFLTYAQVKQQARSIGSCLRKEYGIGPKEKVSIWSGNSVEWLVADLACAAFNFTSVSVYDTLGPDAASYIVADSGSQALVCEDKTFMKVPALLDDPVYITNAAKALKVVAFIGKGDPDTKATLERKGLKVFDFKAVAESSASPMPDTPPSSEDILTIMYTSGTTGMPKGVMLSHLNVVSTVSMLDLTPALTLTSDDVHLCYLPLAHIFERQNALGVLKSGGVIYFPSMGTRNLLADLGIVRPTIFAGVPKVYENVRDAVNRKMTGIAKKMFDAALDARIADLETGCGYPVLWDMLIFKKTKQALGGRVKFCITGGAPISKETLHFVISALAPVVQGYGATETCAASTVGMPFDPYAGHVGPPLGTVAVRLVDVPDMNYFSGPADIYKEGKAKAAFAAGKNKSGGEVWIGGPAVSKGYYDGSVHGTRPGVPSNGMSKKTEEDFFKEDGWPWFKTGDIGMWTDSGCLKIVDRKKNMFKTSLGEYIPVEEVEKAYQDSCPYADFVFLPKETKVAYVALCVVVSDSISTVMRWAKENGVEGDDKTVVGSSQFKQLLFNEFEKIAKDKKLQRFMWIGKDNIHAEYQPLNYQEQWVGGVTCANGHKEQLLTATFKARRAQLDAYFAPQFEKIYPGRPKDHILP